MNPAEVEATRAALRAALLELAAGASALVPFDPDQVLDPDRIEREIRDLADTVIAAARELRRITRTSAV